MTTFFPFAVVITIYSLKLAGIWNFSRNYMNVYATASGLSSWMTCPTLSITTILNFPCICAIVRSLSILSFPASKSYFGTWTFKKEWVSPVNHSVQYYFEASRSVRHTHTFYPLESSFSITWAGIETYAEARFLTVPEFTPYLTTDWILENYWGLEETMLSMNGSASIADPSATSMMKRPLICECSGQVSLLVSM